MSKNNIMILPPDYRALNPYLPSVFVVDLDGTLTLLNGRNPYDPHRCIKDLPHAPVIKLVQILQESMDCVAVSGRFERAREDTLTWLEMYDIKPIKLLMRAEDDYRKDTVVKKEVGETLLKEYNIQFVIDDRDQEVKMWRHDLNVPCFQVWDGGF